MAIAFRGLFYFAAKGLWKSGLKGQHRVPSGVKRVRLFHITIVDVGVKFHVQGFLHTGYVQVVLNEGEDLFEVTLISEEGETLNKIEHIFVDNLISILDSEIEKCENYEERISQEYGIITETEK